MKNRFTFSLAGILLVAMVQVAFAADTELRLPKTVEAGSAFSIPTAGSGKATLFIVGPNGVFRRDVQLGEAVEFQAGEITNAGHYLAFLAGDAGAKGEFDVIAAPKPATLSFLAKPSRLSVDQRDGVSGVVYPFDIYGNLILEPLPVSFALSSAAAGSQSKTVTSQNGVAWTRMNSAPRAGIAQFSAAVESVREIRIVQEVPGDPCSLRMNAKRVAQKLVLETEPVRDCSGNPVADGTVISFTESRGGHTLAAVDVPLKHDIAQTELPAYNGATVSVATGVVMGNDVRMGNAR